MPVISIKIPQLGEGLQEALLVEFLKKPGEDIALDEPIYVMETDKATTEVESPYRGTLVEWKIEPGSVVPIGAVIGLMQVADEIREPAGSSQQVHTRPATKLDTTTRPSKVLIPPKTRKCLKDHNLLEIAAQIPRTGNKLMPEDIEAYLAGSDSAASDRYTLEPLPKSQIVLNYRLAQSARDCVPVTLIRDMDWTAFERAREQARASGGPTEFAMLCWVVVQALKDHPKFRSALHVDRKSLKVFHHVNLGVAVALPDDELVTAVISNADTLSADAFFAAYDQQVELARSGVDQADEATTISVSNIGIGRMRIGIPAIVAPAVATLAIGETFAHPVPQADSFKFTTMATAALCFDHRIVNGIGAARFMNAVAAGIESFEI
jgi:pyruvate/2-oxoglutarate dehydrogenase complex dihydrolipoamide acyltransferase (E2) component